ncbi:translation initiation factor IF-1 [Candidatus Shapirobacteria bacterium]|nr:translation initiation factor IF-1 [Candidatus Shapirobacteria bacterium]
MSNNSQKQDFYGLVVKSLPDTTFRVKLENDQEVFAYLSGRMRQNYIRIVPGDKVKVEMDVNDPTKGRITYREK